MTTTKTLAILFVVTAGITLGQTSPPPPAFTYDVVSIHKSDPLERNVHIGDDGPQGGLRTSNTTVLQLIAAAWNIQDYQIIGAPGWASSGRFNVIFTPDKTEIIPDYVKSQKEYETYWSRNQQRLQAVLRDRFGLVLRVETRELPIYALVQTKNGNKLQPHRDAKTGPSISTNNGRQIRATEATMDMLAMQLSMQLARPVHNETGLDGQYDFRIDWTPESEPLGPSIFTAISDQLGLRLESTKGPVRVYVVEKIELPSDN